jgi:hypothetical protein
MIHLVAQQNRINGETIFGHEDPIALTKTGSDQESAYDNPQV